MGSTEPEARSVVQHGRGGVYERALKRLHRWQGWAVISHLIMDWEPDSEKPTI
jgi:hypothetical protein